MSTLRHATPCMAVTGASPRSCTHITRPSVATGRRAHASGAPAQRATFRAANARNTRLVASALGPAPGSGLTPELKASIDKVIESNKVVLFMKGTKQFPQCGFSNTVVQIMNALNVPFHTVNILEDPTLRQGMKEYSQWPTFPQVYIAGEFFGGCDITLQAFQSGELQQVVDKAFSP